jgi:hypothetical protein
MALILYLPAATTVGDRVGVRLDPTSLDTITVTPDGTDDINGESSFAITLVKECVNFVVGEVGHWWIESDYLPEFDWDFFVFGSGAD